MKRFRRSGVGIGMSARFAVLTRGTGETGC